MFKEYYFISLYNSNSRVYSTSLYQLLDNNVNYFYLLSLKAAPLRVKICKHSY